MGTQDKLIMRFKKKPRDFTWDELTRMLASFGFEKVNKGKTSGSRMAFKKEGMPPILLHKPHPGNILKAYTMKQILDFLTEYRLIN